MKTWKTVFFNSKLIKKKSKNFDQKKIFFFGEIFFGRKNRFFWSKIQFGLLFRIILLLHVYFRLKNYSLT